MFKVKVFTVGRCKEEWLALALAEYEKRLKGQWTVEWRLAKDDAQLRTWALAESFVALDPQGALLSSEALSQKVEGWGPRLNFVIGEAEGLSKEILQAARFVWSLSPLTFTHQMTRLILMEQLYRAREISRGSGYHK